MGTPTQAARESISGVYLWKIPAKPIAVQLDLDVIDSVLPEVMRAYGAVPKRGAEVGGLLLGSIDRSSEAQTLVRVQQVEVVPCVYARGPSYLFTDEDRTAFQQARERWAQDAARPIYAVGYFRSHTRDGLSLSSDDRELLDRHFPNPADIALLIRPFVGKPIQAGFFFRENGAFQEETPLPFLFSRRELAGETVSSPKSREQQAPATEPSPPPKDVERDPVTQMPRAPQWTAPRRIIPLPEESFLNRPETTLQEPVPPVIQPSDPERKRSGVPSSVWIPLCFTALAVGLLVGLMAPYYLGTTFGVAKVAPYALGLNISRTGDSLTVHWNPDAPAIRAARSGTLEIEDGGYSKPVELDAAHLQNGSIIYRNSSPSVKFRLTLSEGVGITLVETVEWSP